MDKEVNVLAMMKGEERYVFLYDEENRTETLRMLGRYAADPQLSFSWNDAAVMSKKIRELSYDLRENNMPAHMQPNARFSFRKSQDLI